MRCRRRHPLGRSDWIVTVALVAVGLVAAAGLPRPRASYWALGSAAAQCAGACSAAVGTVIGSAVGHIWIFGPEDRCVYVSCWPADAQTAIAAVPGLLSVAALVVAAMLVWRVDWLPRAVLPAASWLTATLVLRSAWQPWLLPVLRAPPP